MSSCSNRRRKRRRSSWSEKPLCLRGGANAAPIVGFVTPEWDPPPSGSRKSKKSTLSC